MKRDDQENNTVERVGVEGDRIPFEMDRSAKAFQILSDNLYSRPIEAIIRELACNAYDSHCRNGNPDEPFEVKLPTQMDREFYIRDFGEGMRPQKVEELYTSVFKSDKTDTNDQIGAFGVGSKSPFAYKDQFTVTSIVDGEKWVYSIHYDEEGIPEANLMESGETDDRDGVKISFMVEEDEKQFDDGREGDYFHPRVRGGVIPQKGSNNSTHPAFNNAGTSSPSGLMLSASGLEENLTDIELFQRRAARVFHHFEVRPDFKGQYEPQFESPVMEGENWRCYSLSNWSRRPFLLRMGNVAYEVDPEIIDTDVRLEGMVLDFDIGELKPAASRERVQVDNELRSRIEDRVRALREKIEARIRGYIDQCDGYREALNIRDHNLHDLKESIDDFEVVQTGISNPLMDRFNFSISEFEYEGTPLEKKITLTREDLSVDEESFSIVKVKNSWMKNRSLPYDFKVLQSEVLVIPEEVYSEVTGIPLENSGNSRSKKKCIIVPELEDDFIQKLEDRGVPVSEVRSMEDFEEKGIEQACHGRTVAFGVDLDKSFRENESESTERVEVDGRPKHFISSGDVDFLQFWPEDWDRSTDDVFPAYTDNAMNNYWEINPLPEKAYYVKVHRSKWSFMDEDIREVGRHPEELLELVRILRGFGLQFERWPIYGLKRRFTMSRIEDKNWVSLRDFISDFHRHLKEMYDGSDFHRAVIEISRKGSSASASCQRFESDLDLDDCPGHHSDPSDETKADFSFTRREMFDTIEACSRLDPLLRGESEELHDLCDQIAELVEDELDL